VTGAVTAPVACASRISGQAPTANVTAPVVPNGVWRYTRWTPNAATSPMRAVMRTWLAFAPARGVPVIAGSEKTAWVARLMFTPSSTNSTVWPRTAPAGETLRRVAGTRVGPCAAPGAVVPRASTSAASRSRMSPPQREGRRQGAAPGPST
jgi:hypothetical protein